MKPASNPASNPFAKTASRPFKKFYCDDKEVFRLPGVAFKIWMYHYSREGKSRQSWPTVDTICEALDINKSTLQRWRKFLIQNGWLEKVGEHRRLDGEFNVPIFKVKRGAVDEIISDGRRHNSVHRRRNDHLPTETNKSFATGTIKSATDRDEIIIHEVDSGVLDSAEVESGVLECKPAHSFSDQTHGQDEAREQAFEQLAEDEQEILNHIPTPVVEFVNAMTPLSCPLDTSDYPNDSPLILPYTEPDGYLSEASMVENYALACTALSFTKNPARMFLGYDATWELDRLYGNGKSVDLAEAVAEHCPKHRAFIYSYLAHSLIHSTEACTENGQPDELLASEATNRLIPL